ncbi:putative transposable element [Trichonephila clavipes]|uniref:Putative transposable element n=1 Tax=Trichonephila clavipes TaxID=2585209 RepID=A0A8X6RS85_TRICX|nr:putative transposable element [Trichonephila clavipes]
MTFWEYTSTGLAWLLTRPAHSAAMPEWMATTFSNALDLMNTRLMTSSVGIATRGLLVTDHVNLNHGQVTWTTPELAPPLLTTTPHQREDVSALDRFNVHRCPTRRVFSGTGLEPVTKQATVRYLYHSATAATHFWLNGYVNKQNCRISSEANPQVYVETPLHPEKLTVWCALWAGGIIGAVVPRFGPVNWPPRSCDLTPLDYFLWGYVKSLVYADKPQTLDHLEDNIRRAIADIRPQMLEKVIENWTFRLDYIRASRGSRMPGIIFKTSPVRRTGIPVNYIEDDVKVMIDSIVNDRIRTEEKEEKLRREQREYEEKLRREEREYELEKLRIQAEKEC